jgi:hypothetical protein
MVKNRDNSFIFKGLDIWHLLNSTLAHFDTTCHMETLEIERIINILTLCVRSKAWI